MSLFSRRGFLKALGIGAGAAVGTRLPGAGWLGRARAAEAPSSVVILHMQGGYNAIWSSADSLVGKFGVAAGNYTPLGNGLAVDDIFATTMSAFVKDHMASVGVRHGISNHPGAQQALWTHQNQNAGLALAAAMGGTASIKAAVVGGNLIKSAPAAPVGGVSFQAITDMETTVEALGGGAGARMPDRTVSAAAMEGAQKMSNNALAGSPGSLASLNNGYVAAIDTLRQDSKQFDLAGLKAAYGVTTDTVKTFQSKLAAAELMVRAGTNVVSLFDGGWDTHGDSNGAKVRQMMKARMPALNTFLTRMVEDATRNVTVLIMGDFSRSLPNSGHQPNLSATVIGRNVKRGTTGKTAQGTVSLSANTPRIDGMWSLLGALAKAETPFGKNQHPSLAL